MSSSVENYHYVVHNEFEKPTQLATPPQNVLAFKNALHATPQHSKLTQSNESSGRESDGDQIPKNGAKTNLTELAELISSAAGKQGHDGNVNVYNKCVFFVNSYSNGDVQDATRILDQLSGPFPKPRNRPPDCFEIPDEFAESVSLRFNSNGYHDAESLVESENIIDIATPVASTEASCFSEDPIVVSSDSESEPVIERMPETEPSNKLFFVDKYDLKPILSPHVLPGVYKKLSPVKDPPSKCSVSNVYTDAREKSGTIMKTKDFEASFVANCDITTETEHFCENIPPKHILEQRATHPVDVPLKKPIENHVPIQEKQTVGGRNKDKERLWRLAYDILKLPIHDSRVHFNSGKHELVYRSPSTKKKIIYRIVQPTDLDLRSDAAQNFQLGNPTFIQCISNVSTQIEVPIMPIAKLTQNSVPKRPRGRPRKRAATVDDQRLHRFAQSIPAPQPLIYSTPIQSSSPTSRTRCGRVSKLPQYIESNFRVTSEANVQFPSFDIGNDSVYRCGSDANTALPVGDIDEPHAAKRERNVPPEYRCSGCNKIYLGKNRMIRHFGAFPDHFKNAGVEEMIKDTSLYTFLVKKVEKQNLTEDQRITLLLNELTDFVNQLQSRRSQLVTNNSAFYFVNSVVSKIIGAPEGHYGVNLSALSAPPPPVIENALIQAAPPRLDYNLSISLDDTLVDAKLNLSENMITSDDSLLRTVDDLVKEGMKNLTGDVGIGRDTVSSVINYDHASDNAVEAVNMKEMQPPPILDLSLDLFQFNSN